MYDRMQISLALVKGRGKLRSLMDSVYAKIWSDSVKYWVSNLSMEHPLERWLQSDYSIMKLTKSHEIFLMTKEYGA